MFWITIDQIKCFQAVIEEGSFTKASERLMRAKSAVRYAVNNLEEQLGFKLLDRKSYRPQATSQGEAFLYKATNLLREYDSLQLYSQQISSEIEMQLNLSVTDIYEMDSIFPIIKETMNQFPNTEIRLEREILSGEKMLLKEMVDLSVCEEIRNRSDLEFKQIDEIELILVVAKDSKFYQLPKKQQTFDELHKFPQIFQRSTIPDNEDHRGLSKQSIKWNVTDTTSKKDFILNGLGWGRMPKRLIQKELDNGQLVHLKKFNFDHVASIYLARRKRAFMGKVGQFIWDHF